MLMDGSAHIREASFLCYLTFNHDDKNTYNATFSWFDKFDRDSGELRDNGTTSFIQSRLKNVL